MASTKQPLLAGQARLCSTCVNDELTFVVFPAVSFNTKPPVIDSTGELGLAGDDGELHLLSLMLPLQLSRLYRATTITSYAFDINTQPMYKLLLLLDNKHHSHRSHSNTFCTPVLNSSCTEMHSSFQMLQINKVLTILQIRHECDTKTKKKKQQRKTKTTLAKDQRSLED